MRTVGCIEPEGTSPLDKLISLAVLALFLTGCPAPMTTEVTETLEKIDTIANTQPLQLAAGQGIVIVDDVIRPETDVVCIRETIEKKAPKLRIVLASDVRDALRRDVEKRATLVDDLLDGPLVAEQLISLGVGYVVTVGNYTYPSGGLNPAASGGRSGLAAGAGTADISTIMKAQLWDVERRSLAVTLTAVSRGTQILFFPLMFHPYTESSACTALAERIASVLTSKATK